MMLTELQRWNLFVYYAQHAKTQYLSQGRNVYFLWFRTPELYAVKLGSTAPVTLKSR